MIVKLLTEHHLEFLSLKGGCRGSSQSTLSKCQIVGNLMPQLRYLMKVGKALCPISNEKLVHKRGLKCVLTGLSAGLVATLTITLALKI